jgi:hypothetical protein
MEKGNIDWVVAQSFYMAIAGHIGWPTGLEYSGNGVGRCADRRMGIPVVFQAKLEILCGNLFFGKWT